MNAWPKEYALQQAVILDAMESDLPSIPSFIYMVLGTFADNETRECRISIADLANTTGCSPSTIKKHLPILIERGYIFMKSGKSKRETNVYGLRIKPAAQVNDE